MLCGEDPTVHVPNWVYYVQHVPFGSDFSMVTVALRPETVARARSGLEASIQVATLELVDRNIAARALWVEPSGVPLKGYGALPQLWLL